MTTSHFLQDPSSGINVVMQLNEDTGHFTCTMRPQLRKDQLPAFFRRYCQWCSTVARAWSSRHGNGRVTVDFNHLLSGEIRQQD
jgi:hypothetical protein